MFNNKPNDDPEIITITNEKFVAILKLNNCTFRMPKSFVTAEVILKTIQDVISVFEEQKFRSQNEVPNLLANLELNLHLIRSMHHVISKSSHIQKIRYLQLVGDRPEISRQDGFREAVNFYNFNNKLSAIGILNYFASEHKTKRIIAVHPTYVDDDEEITMGLKVMHHKYPEDYPVFVESEESLKYALDDCLIGTTLVIDGHWEHKKKSRHGVWWYDTADNISQKIADAVNAVPGKITHVNLLGCESGKIDNKENSAFNKNMLFFKYDQKPTSADRDMGLLRNRAVYVGTKEDSVFDDESLAFQVLARLSDPLIAVTATPKILYPWPPEEPIFNIGSDSENWEDKPQSWIHKGDESELSVLLGEIKSVTQINPATIASHSKRPWKYRA